MSCLTDILGENNKINILQYFVEWEDCNLSLNDISKNAGIKKVEAQIILENFYKLGIIEKNESLIAKRDKFCYKLNLNNKISKCFKELFNAIIQQNIENT